MRDDARDLTAHLFLLVTVELVLNCSRNFYVKIVLFLYNLIFYY